MHPLSCWIVYTKEVNFVPCRSIRPVYTVPANKPIQIPPLFRTGKNTNCTSEIRLFRPVNAYRTETRKRRRRRRKKKKKNVLTLSSLHSSASLAVSQTHSVWSFLPQTPDLFYQRFPSLFQIYFLFPLSSFFVLGCVQCMPNSLKFNFFKHPIKLTACKCDV